VDGRPLLVEPDRQAEVEARGYTVVPLLDPDEVIRLRTFYEEHRAQEAGVNPPDAYDPTYAEFSVIHSWPDFRRRTFELLDEVVARRAGEHLVGMRPLVANFVNKPPGSGVVPAHQNWAVVDEQQHRSISVWVALVDVDVENGALHFVDGSHQRFRGPRGMWSYTVFSELEEDLIEHLTAVRVQAGEAILLDDAIIHYSPPNHSEADRLAIQMVMVPEEATPVFHHQVGEDAEGLLIDTWRVQPPFFWDFWHGEGDLRWAEHAERFTLPRRTYDLDAVLG
jgi:hypothetical protein